VLVACKSTGTISGKHSVHHTQNEANDPKRDGLTMQTAIISMDKTETVGIENEYRWLRQHYPGYKFRMQALLSEGSHVYDKFDIVTADGKEMSIYMDICNFYGK
jgi:hypothetical protein